MDYFRSNRFLDSLSDWETGRPAPGPMDDYMPRMRALLRRVGNPQQRFFSIIVGGTNGKGTVASLLAAFLQASGRRVGLYTSPHLHSVRERIRLDGRALSKDQWAEGVTRLCDHTRDFEAEGRGPFTKFEALTALAAQAFAGEDADCGVFEVGLGGRYDATNAWDSQVAVLTSVGLDHVEVLGDTLVAIAADKLQIARPGRPLFTTAAQEPEVLEHIRRHSEQHHLELVVATAEPNAAPSSVADAPAGAPADLPLRPHTYGANAALALAVAAHALGRDPDPEAASRVVREHQWPGRFETAREQPLVLLDGAHNPAAAAALAEDLGRISRSWRFVVGASSGHDAEGVLRALQPLAADMLLTGSDHPRAVNADALARCAPAGLSTTVEPECTRAFRTALDSLGPEDHLCIAGSLHLVARAREFFALPGDSDGVSEDMTLESLECVEAACRSRGLACARASDNGHVLRVEWRGRPLYFLRNKHPFND